jgi:GH15 family glucan-1,4-alpha-glucosidase
VTSIPQDRPLPPPHAPVAGEYPPIAEHGVIGDLRSAALVATDGTIDWFCCPRFDSPSVFASILDRHRGGFYRIAPAQGPFTPKQLYLPDTNVLITRFLTTEGVGEVQDFMAIRSGVGQTASRLFRRVVAVRGHMTLRLEVEPRFDYGRATHVVRAYENGVVFISDKLSLALETELPLRDDETGVQCEFTLHAGESVTFVLTAVDEEYIPRVLSEEATRGALEDTIDFWRRWVAGSRYEGRWREMLTRSALTLKLLTYQPTGALLAAATTSLPEETGGERNWDYRYTWIRDAALSIYGLLVMGFTEEAAGFMQWLTERLRGEQPTGQPLQVMYDIHGGAELNEEILDHLEGYRGSRPVRIGNLAAKQLQIDIYGELIDSVHLYNRGRSTVFHDTWEHLVRVVDWLCEHWDQADEGIWEVRSGRQKFTHSRLMSWVGLERALRIALERALPADLLRWQRTRDDIYRQIMAQGWNDQTASFTQHYDTEIVDAGLLLMPMVGFLAPTDPRWLSTLDRITGELVSDGLVYRYNSSRSPDGLEGEEGTFSICTFWYVEALARAGRLDEARLAFEKMFTYANHVGLYSEQIGLTGELLGNFPQAFTHIGLISAGAQLDRQLSGKRRP